VSNVRQLDHPNVCRFIGASFKPDEVQLFYEFCPKGSLYDILKNENVPLNWAFRFSFALDIAKGMSYLHNKRASHGYLTSKNCLVDDRWTVKITDFGLSHLRLPSVKKRTLTDLNRFDGNLMDGHANTPITYISPELYNMSPWDGEGSFFGDVYSFGVVLKEIAGLLDPYLQSGKSMEKIHNTLKQPAEEDLEKVSCPCPKQLELLLSQCLSKDPSFRPTFESIKNTLETINPNQLSPVDMMMNMMDKYSKHLELLVAIKTQNLECEKQKTETLLYSMLPKQVADNLKQGIHTQAELFSSCTIFFSDIVGFTAIASQATPMEIVNLLNQLYIVFDNTTSNYDVYKVETIGDAYMVVSGLPDANGKKHATHIARMGLDLIEVSQTFCIPHTDEKLKIRAGIHSGAVCAGVVGRKMPRYCLFGDAGNFHDQANNDLRKIQATGQVVRNFPCQTLKIRKVSIVVMGS
jgi:atrial natriuretic peptide receptor B